MYNNFFAIEFMRPVLAEMITKFIPFPSAD